MELIWICLATFFASGLTLFSGFGLGTILMPVIAIFLPVPIAVAITAIVHAASKLFKLLLVWRHINSKVLVSFGLPAMAASIAGALLLGKLAALPPLFTYSFLGTIHLVMPVKLIAGVLLMVFAAAEQFPFLRNRSFQRMGLTAGGLLSGFFGGLTGHQGAFRSAFLVQENFSEKSFVATNAGIAILVDAMRIFIYGLTFDFITMQSEMNLVWAAIAASFLGVFLAAELLEKVTIQFIRTLVAVLMYIFGVLLCLGII